MTGGPSRRMGPFKALHVLGVLAACLLGLAVGLLGQVVQAGRACLHKGTRVLCRAHPAYAVAEGELDEGLLSVVVPTWNEAPHIRATLLACLQATHRVEVLVVDGGSNDGTAHVVSRLAAGQHNVRLLGAQQGRASQQNAGAAQARGCTLLFLHADTKLPPGYDTIIRTVLRDPHVALGAFELGIDTDDPALHTICWAANTRARYYGLPYGDQGLFMRTVDFRAVGGFPDQVFMEDYELVRLLARRGTVRIVPPQVRTSPRRWQAKGAVRTTLLNQWFVLAYAVLGLDARTIHTWYYAT